MESMTTRWACRKERAGDRRGAVAHPEKTKGEREPARIKLRKSLLFMIKEKNVEAEGIAPSS